MSNPVCYTGPDTQRWTRTRRLAVLLDLKAGKTFPEAILANHGIDASELALWGLAHDLMPVDGLKAKNLTKLARELRDRSKRLRRARKPYGVARAISLLRSTETVA
jgi:hypothetical protein